MAIFLKCLIDCNFIATCKQKMIPLYFCLSEFYGHGTSDIMSAELCCLHGLESVVAGLTTKFRTKNKKTFLKFVYHQLMFHVENVQFGESAWSLIISKWFLFSLSSICLSIASSIGIRLDGAVFTTNCISRIVSSKNTGNSWNRASIQKWMTMRLLTSLSWWLKLDVLGENN